MRVVLIGTGNVATVLGRMISAAGYEVIQVYGRKGEHARVLAEELQTDFTTIIKDIYTHADIYIIAVADTAIPAVAASLQVKDKLIVHTAGSVSREVLKAGSSRYGILYPLQSLRKEMKHLPEVPLIIDANNSDDLSLLIDLARRIGGHTVVVGDEERLKLHVAAVIVSNFTNHLYALAEQYCKKEEIFFPFFYPLISEVADRLQYISPQEAQTGPAIRNDTTTIQKHLELLEGHGNIKDLYAWFTKSIQTQAASNEL